MVTYKQSPRELPPMLNEAVSLAGAGFDVEALSFAAGPEAPHTEEHAPGFRTRRFRVRTRSFFQAILGHASRNRLAVAVQYGLSYAEYVTKALVYALRSRADMYEAHDLPPVLPALIAAKLRRRPIVYRAHELWSETHAKVPFAALWRFMDRTLVPLCDQVARSSGPILPR
jgi:hypothetical protein